MKLEMIHTRPTRRYTCLICGGATNMKGDAFQIVDQDNNKVIDICGQCLAAGIKGKLDERIDQVIEKLKEHINDLEWAKKLDIENYSTWDEFQKFRFNQKSA